MESRRNNYGIRKNERDQKREGARLETEREGEGDIEGEGYRETVMETEKEIDRQGETEIQINKDKGWHRA